MVYGARLQEKWKMGLESDNNFLKTELRPKQEA